MSDVPAWVPPPPPSEVDHIQRGRRGSNATRIFACRVAGELVEICLSRDGHRPMRGEAQEIRDSLGLARVLGELLPRTVFRLCTPRTSTALSGAAFEHAARRALETVR